MTNNTADQSPTVNDFRIEIADSALDDLRRRLRDARFPEPLPGDDWQTGIPSDVLRNLIGRWAEHDWRATETRLNALPQITTRIEDQTIHAVHVRSAVSGATPLLLLHGWPGSFLEFEGLIGPLIDPASHGGSAGDAFDVVIPSLPGFGFSTPLESDGWTTARIATTLIELMTRLGYEKFAVQGGDVGSGVAQELGRITPDRVIGVHLNGATGYAVEPDEETATGLTPLEQDRLARISEYMQNEFGYIAIQSTRPGLVGQMLTDSPTGQFAWIYDKLQALTYPADTAAIDILGPEFVFANASLYWFTASAGSAAYVGYAQTGAWDAEPVNAAVPTAAIQFAHDVGLRYVAEQSNTIVRWTDISDRGGHFAALEEPTVLTDDIRDFFRNIRG